MKDVKEDEIKAKSPYDYKLGEICDNKSIGGGFLQPLIKLVKIGYTFQDKNGVQMEQSLKIKDFVEEDNSD